ncbi:MAG: hypothetical protein RR720_20890 [Comamonas sp.]|uniref:hypothetical protein n=1 Tax=Comamonas sp. TaxID=34028 RepID=UPI002FC87518
MTKIHCVHRAEGRYPEDATKPCDRVPNGAKPGRIEAAGEARGCIKKVSAKANSAEVLRCNTYAYDPAEAAPGRQP